MWRLAAGAVLGAVVVYVGARLWPVKRRRKVQYVHIEGNTGVGKSTVLQGLKRRHPDLRIVEEPVGKWQNFRGNNMLALRYQDPKKWATTFQMLALLTVAQTVRDERDSFVMERSWFTRVNVFGVALRNAGYLDEVTLQVLDEGANFIQSFIGDPAPVIYLRSRPEVCQERMRRRARDEEAGVPLAYLQQLHDLYESWLLRDYPGLVHVVDADNDTDKVLLEVEAILRLSHILLPSPL